MAATSTERKAFSYDIITNHCNAYQSVFLSLNHIVKNYGQ